jgi:phage terminase Nu1 subunit (DNA packaging protein)
MNEANHRNGDRLLSSWKEIATCLNRGVRTVQRWERCGLPVRRPAGAESNVVMAVESDLREWLKNSKNRRASMGLDLEELQMLSARLAIVKEQIRQIDVRLLDLQQRVDRLKPEAGLRCAS